MLSSRGLAPVDVDVEAEARIRAGNPTSQGQGCCIMATFRFPLSPECRQQGTYVKTQLLRGRSKQEQDQEQPASLPCALLITLIKPLFSYSFIHSFGLFFFLVTL